MNWNAERTLKTTGALVKMKMMIALCAVLGIALWGTNELTYAQSAPASKKKSVALKQVPGKSGSVATRPASSGLPSPPSIVKRKQTVQSSLIVTKDYIIGPEDVLEISVWRNADLSKQVQVRPDGRISLPLIGDVTAVGKTPVQLTEDIAGRLKEYKENPTVAIVVQQVNSYAIFMLGEVRAPGKYPLKSKTTLLQAITIAGGFTPVAARNKLVIFRFGENGDGEYRIKASYDAIVLRDSSAQNIELKPGDTIVVPSETMVMIP